MATGLPKMGVEIWGLNALETTISSGAFSSHCMALGEE
jgi:hypothetical protein